MRYGARVGIVEHMFAISLGHRAGTRPTLSPVLAARVRPVSSTRDRLLPLAPPLAPLFADGALRRGTTVLVSGAPGCGATTLAFGLLVAVSAAGGWCAAVGPADPGAVALAELGVDLQRLVLVPVGGGGWADTAATLVDGLDVVLARPRGRTSPTAARHLVAKTRDRQAVLVVLGSNGRPPSDRAWRGSWTEAPDVHLQIGATSWRGVERGHAPLQARLAEVSSSGRRTAVRPVRRALWLPGADGRIAEAGVPQDLLA